MIIVELQLTENALRILEKRYLRRGPDGSPAETPEEMFRRVARNLAVIDALYFPECYDAAGGCPPQGGDPPYQWLEHGLGRLTAYDVRTLYWAYRRLDAEGHMRVPFAEVAEYAAYSEAVVASEEELFGLMIRLEFLFNSPTLMNAGTELQQLSACFVLPVEDSMVGIFETVKRAAIIHKTGGGTGFAFSRLRPKGDLVRSTGGEASGPISFMRVFDAAAEAVEQGGKRRGANMGVLRVDHPDIEEFVTCKLRPGEFENFNISVGLTEEFMRALQEGRDYALVNPRTGEEVRGVPAKKIFDMIVDAAWRSGEPGVLFFDRINATNPTPWLGEIEGTNPCGETPLLPYESCNLGSVNLACMVKVAGGRSEVDWEKLSRTVRAAVHYLDNVIDANLYPFQEIEQATLLTRKVGLGVMGFADMLFMLGIPYDSEEAVSLAREVMAFISREARGASEGLARERGPYPAITLSKHGKVGKFLRNATLTTIAPTGSISIIADTTSGIEPAFALAYAREVVGIGRITVFNPVFEAKIRERFPRKDAERLLAEVARTGRLSGVDGMPEDLRRVFVTAHEIAPEWHVRMQAAFQESTDNAVSKTVNLPASATREDVAKIYLMAYDLHCKGVTVYREGSREGVLSAGEGGVQAGHPAETKMGTTDRHGRVYPAPRPNRTVGFTEQAKTGCGKIYITVNRDPATGELVETFITTGSSGGCAAYTEGVSRLVSLALRAGVAPEAVADQLTSVVCPNFLRRRASDPALEGRSCPDVIGRVLMREAGARPESQEVPDNAADTSGGLPCPECGSPLAFQEGCLTCRCGYSKCG
ncbi:MAG: vitamin B12-dependent ribonucleotide reductase [Moorellaceae bacterium]